MSWSIDHLECVALRLELGISETSLVPRLLYARESGNEAKVKLDGTTRKRSSLVHSQILSRSRGEKSIFLHGCMIKSIFLHGCEIQSGSGLGTRLEKNGLGTRPSKSRKEGLVNWAGWKCTLRNVRNFINC